MSSKADQRKWKKLDDLIRHQLHPRKRHRRKRHRRQTEPIPTPDNNGRTVVNLSNITLSEAETSLLAKGLSFCPTPPKLDSFQLKTDLGVFCRRLRLKEFFYDEEADVTDNTINPFRCKSRWTPARNRVHAFEAFVQAVTEDVDHSLVEPHRRPRRDNLTREERSPKRPAEKNRHNH